MRPFCRTLGLLLLATATWFGCPERSAAAPSKAPVTNVDSIRHFMEKGQTLFLGGQHLRAAEIFDAGYELHPYSAFLFNAGVALEKGGKPNEAIEHFRRYLEVDTQAPDRADVERRIARIEKALEEEKLSKKKSEPQPDALTSTESATKSLVILETEPMGAPFRLFRRVQGDSQFLVDDKNPGWEPVQSGQSPANASLDVGHYHVVFDAFGSNNRGETTFDVLSGHVIQVKVNLSQGQFMGHLRVTTNVSQASLYLDDEQQKGVPWGKAPFADFVPTGDHVLVIAKTGFVPVRRVLHLKRAEQQELQIELQRLDYGKLRVSSNVDATEIAVDGKPCGMYFSGSPPLEVPRLKAGPHRLRLTARGRKPLETEVQVPAGQALPVSGHLVVTPPRGAAWTQAIIGGALLGGGIYLGLESNRLYDEMSRERAHATLANDDPRVLRGKLFAIGADIAFGGSVILGGLATYNFLTDPLPPSRLIVGKAVEFDTANRPLRTDRDEGAAESGRLRTPRTIAQERLRTTTGIIDAVRENAQ